MAIRWIMGKLLGILWPIHWIFRDYEIFFQAPRESGFEVSRQVSAVGSRIGIGNLWEFVEKLDDPEIISKLWEESKSFEFEWKIIVR